MKLNELVRLFEEERIPNRKGEGVDQVLRETRMDKTDSD